MSESTSRQVFSGIVATVVGGLIVWGVTTVYHTSKDASSSGFPQASGVFEAHKEAPNPVATDQRRPGLPAASQFNQGRPNSASGQEGLEKQSPVETDRRTEPAPERYRIDAIIPSDGQRDDYAFVLKECHHSADVIRCWGLITNTTDAPRLTVLEDSTAVDDEGNSISIWTFGGGFMFPGANTFYGSQEKLLPGVPTKFTINVNDPHRNVHGINFALRTGGGQPYHYDTLILKDVPVQ